jgi:putative protease
MHNCPDIDREHNSQLKKKMTREEIEIMAPAGSWESLSAAIKAGADSVYFGIEKLNMRSKSSSNFTTDLQRK